MDRRLLDMLCCPVSNTPLVTLTSGFVRKLNEKIASGEVQYVDGTLVEHPAESALITEDRKVVYLLEDEIPVLLPERGIGSTQFDHGFFSS